MAKQSKKSNTKANTTAQAETIQDMPVETAGTENKNRKDTHAGNGGKRKASSAALAIGTDRKRIRTIRILAFLIPVIAVLLGMLAGSFAPFGGKDVMTAGGNSAHLTYYYELYDRVHEGKGLVYSLTSGSGYDFSTIFTYYLSDPLNLIILIFPRTAILAVINLLYALKIGLAGLFFSMFLTRRKARIEAAKASMEEQRADAIAAIAKHREAKKAKAKKDLVIGGTSTPSSGFGGILARFDFPILAFSIAYALSSYMLGQGLNVGNLTAVAIFPLLLMALEDLMESGKWKLYAAMMTASVFCSLQMAIIIFIFSILYALLFDHKDIHHAIRNLLLKLVSDLLAAGAGALIILNCIGSATLRDQVSFKFPYGGVVTSFFDVIKNLLPTAQTSATSTYSYGADVFCGILAVFLFVLYNLNPNISLSRKLRQSGLLLALGSGLMLVTPNYLFNGFSHPEMTFCLFGFLFVAQLLSMAYEAFLNLEHTRVWHLHVSTLLLLALIPVSFFLCDNYDSFSPFLLGMEFLAGYYLLFMLYRNDSMNKWLFTILVPIVLLVETGISYTDNLRLAGSSSTTYEATLDSQYYEASRIVHQAMPNAEVKIYDPENNEDTPVTTTLLNYHFVLASKDVERVDPTLKHLTDYKDVSIYENEYSANGVFVPKSIEDWQFREDAPFTTTNDMILTVLGSDPVFYTALGEPSNGFFPVFDENGVEDVRRLEYLFNFVPEGEGPLYSSLYGIRFHGNVTAGSLTNISRIFTSWEATPTQPKAEYAFFHREGFDAFCDALTIPASKTVSESHVQYAIDAPEDGYLILPYSNLSGWNITSSSTAVGTEDSFLDRVLMVPVSKGTNAVELNYTPIRFYQGILISIAVLAILILLAVKDRLKIRATARGIHTVSEWLLDNYVYVATIAIMCVVFLLMLMHTSSIPFGDNSTLVGDGYLQAYYGYSGTAKSIKGGTFGVLDWNIGIAIDKYNNFIEYLLAPWNLLKLAVLPESLFLFDLCLSYFILFIAPGFTIILYLTHRQGRRMDKHDRRLILIGLAYGLSTYGISYFVYGNFTFLYYLPLLLLAMERLIYRKKPALYILLLFLQMGDAYYAFILCEFLALYFFTMDFENVKDFIRKGIRLAAASIASAGLACFRLIPYYLRTLDSPYKELDTVSPLTKTNGNYLGVISDYMGNRDSVITTTNDFRVNYYIGLLALLVIPLYLLNRKVKLSVRIRRTILLALYFVAFGNRFLNYIFHGFHYQSQVPNRFSAFFMILLIVMFCEVLLSWQDYDRKTFCIGISVPAVILAGLWCLAAMTELPDPVDTTALILGLLLLAFYLVLAILQLWKKHRTTLRNAMLAVCVVEILLNAFIIFPKSIGSKVPDNRDNESINTLAARNPEMQKPFVATELIADYYNISEATDMVSDSFFSSYATNGHMKLFTKWNLLTSGNSTGYLTGNPLADMMLHIRYNISNSADETSWSHYPMVDQHGTMVLHENSNFLPLGIFFQDSQQLDAWDKTEYSDYTDEGGGNAFTFQNAFSHAMGCGDLYHIIEPEKDGSRITPENEHDITYITADPSEYIEGKQSEIPTQIHLAKDVEGDVYFSYFNTIAFAGTSAAGESDVFDMTMYLPFGRKDYYMRIATFDQEEMNRLWAKLNASTLQDIKISFNTISGTITTPDSGTVYLSLPDMSGWNVYVDGTKTDTRSFLGGIGVPVTAGTHTIEIKYVPRGAWPGIAISCGFLLLLIAYAVIHSRMKKAASKRQNNS